MSTNCNFVTPILATECIGDSLVKINANYSNLNRATCTNITNITNATNRVTAAERIVNQLRGTSLFIPVNFSRAINNQANPNANIFISNVNTTNTPAIRSISTPIGNWTSPVITATIPNKPANCFGVLTTTYFNSNPQGNHGLFFDVRKDASESWHNKIGMDPTGGPGAAWEAESDVTSVIYFNTSTNTFQWRIRHNKNTRANNPYYSIQIKLLGYYIRIV
jgi:hypothetical protein